MFRKYNANEITLLVYAIVAALGITILLSSCGHVVKEDQAAPYSDTNYLSIETELCGMLGVGLNGCYVKNGESVGNRSLVVQGIYQGEVEIISSGCGINLVERYSMNERKAIPLSRLYGKNTLSRNDSCTFRIVLKPDVIKDSKVKMFPRLGRIFIEVLPSDVSRLEGSIGDRVAASSSDSSSITVTLPVKENGKFQLANCSGSPIQGDIVNGVAKLPGLKRDKDCKYQIAFRTDSKKYIWIYYRNVYLRNTDILPDPVVTQKGREFCVTANDSITTFVSINDKWSNSNNLCLNVSGLAIIRTITVKRNSTTFRR